MSKRRLPPGDLERDLAAQDAIGELTDFAPGNPQHKHAALDALKQTMLDKQTAEAAASRAATTARDEAADAEMIYHDAVKGARVSVKGQYGEDSNEAQSVGFKKASEIQRGRRKQLEPPPQ